MTVTGFAELTLQTRDPAALAHFYVRGFGLIELSRDFAFVVEAWDLVERGETVRAVWDAAA